MKAKKFFWTAAICSAAMVMTVPFSSCEKEKKTTETPKPGKPEPEVPEGAVLPDSIKNGSNFYSLYLDATAEAILGNKLVVANMVRAYDVWPAGETLEFVERLGINAWGFPEAWISLNHAGELGWNGGAAIAILEQFATVPDLSALDGSYTFHFAIKSPTNQTTAGTTIFLYSEGPDIKLYVGSRNAAPADQIYLGNYAHDGEWHHFEVPVSKLLTEGYLWTKPLSINDVRDDGNHYRYIFGFQGNPHLVGTEINLDALFFYKKPAQ